MSDDNIEMVGGFKVLKEDQGITVLARAAGTIAYDAMFRELPELNALHRGMLIVDAGAYIGDTARIFLDMGFAVTAFEPQADAFACLKYNCPEADCYNVPLGDGRMVDLTEQTGGNLGARPVKAGNSVKTVRLDDRHLRRVGFLKLDVEGFEPAVLAGATTLLQDPNLQHVLVELNPVALARHGWTTDNITFFFPGWGQRETFRYGEENWDVLFTKPEGA